MFKTSIGALLAGTASAQSWTTTTNGGMSTLSITGNADGTYSKVVVMLHGGGGQGSEWQGIYNEGWFGNTAGIKFMFPTSPLAGGVWYTSTKDPACGMNDACAYDTATIDQTATAVKDLIDAEKASSSINNDGSKIFLGGYSQGGQLSSQVQLYKLDYALGGVAVMSGYPLPPLSAWPSGTTAQAQAAATYSGNAMNWFMWYGADDAIFPGAATQTLYDSIFTVLGQSATVRVNYNDPGNAHQLTQCEFASFATFVADPSTASVVSAGCTGAGGGKTYNDQGNKDGADGENWYCEWAGYNKGQKDDGGKDGGDTKDGADKDEENWDSYFDNCKGAKHFSGFLLTASIVGLTLYM